MWKLLSKNFDYDWEPPLALQLPDSWNKNEPGKEYTDNEVFQYQYWENLDKIPLSKIT